MTLKDFTIEHHGVAGRAPIPFIRMSHIADVMSKGSYNLFCDFMRGQTVLLLEDGEHGVYPVDLDAFLRGCNPLD